MPERSAQPPIRVAMLVAGDLFGGAERQLLTLCRAGGDEFDATVVPTLPGPVLSAARDAGIRCRDYGVGGVLATAWALHRDLARGAFDIIHSHGYRASVIAALAQAAHRSRPVVRTVHGAPESTAAMKLALYEWLGRRADRRSGARIVHVSNELAGRLGRPPGSLVIHNGVEAPAAPGPRPTEFSLRRRNLVAVGRLEPVKALSSLIEAVADVSLRDSVRLHIVGEGPLRPDLEALVHRLGLEGAVSFLGFRTDALNLIAHADALVMSSVHEGIPYVLLEALALGTPVVATNVGGIPEVIRGGTEGLLVPPGSPAALAQALQSIAGDPDLRIRFSRAGRERIAQEFSAKLMARRYSNLYRDVLMKRPSHNA